MTRSIGRSMTGSATLATALPGLTDLPPAPRRGEDFYPSTPDLVAAVLEEVTQDHSGGGIPLLRHGMTVWEPAAGDGAFTAAIAGARRLHVVKATDLVVRPQRVGAPPVRQLDFLSTAEVVPGDTAIITNPPFDIWGRWATHALSLRPPLIVLVAKATVWHARKRADLFQESRPRAHYALTWRPDFLGKGGPTMDIAVVVWQRGWRGETAMRLLHKPDADTIGKWCGEPSLALVGGR